MLSTVQDGGRRKVAAFGISPSGFADWFSAGIANRLAGNQPGAALIETTLNGIAFTARSDMRMAVTGAQATLHVDERRAELWQSHHLRCGQHVTVGPAREGLRSYVAIEGGVSVAPLLASASTDLGAGFGGTEGRAVRDGDTLRIRLGGAAPQGSANLPAHVRLPQQSRPSWPRDATLRVTAGPHADLLAVDELGALLGRRYDVSPHCSRQGVRLAGAPVRTKRSLNMLSFGVCAGCVQLTSDGLPIILLSEHHTTGGYAVVLNVITADLPVAAQLRPGDTVAFARLTIAEGARALEARLGDFSAWEPA
ncbi:MAG: biotin-dependent carboxyltransferase family protein [Candidatus Eremiobacter antarcticus]|nr:biotin-dependent carboxyltransferase family protein [Candidatus Eremiobacteraeota bacterium]MBC5807562.1 biotin-dependent carboxyltransferase family protein [Candidatus Eremiobacteraeota bacterium]